MSKNHDQQKVSFDNNQLSSYTSYFRILKGIRDRLLAQGYKIEQGKIIPPKNLGDNRKKKNPI